MLTLYDILLAADEDALKADILSASIGLGLCSICFAVEVPLAKVERLLTLSLLTVFSDGSGFPLP